MNELSVFIDESGDFGEYSHITPYYIVTLILHDQSSDITTQLQLLEGSLSEIGYPNHCIHVGPIIRRENEYSFVDITVRQKIL